MNLFMKQTHRLRAYGYQWEGWDEGIDYKFGLDM